jgi:predicted nucleotidyltransferase
MQINNTERGLFHMKPYEQPEIQAKLEIIKNAVLTVVPDTDAIYLFGSYAYGEPTDDSDLDVCVVVPDNSVESVYTSEANIYLAVDEKGAFPVDIFVQRKTTYLEQQKVPFTIDRTVQTKGVRIYG